MGGNREYNEPTPRVNSDFAHLRLRWVGLGAGLVMLVLAAALVPWERWMGRRGAQEGPMPPPSAHGDIPRIDVHVHVTPDRAEEAVALFARHHVRLAFNASGGHPGGGLEASAAAGSRAEGRLLPYCSVSFDRVEDPGFAEYASSTLDRCVDLGAVGLKVFKSLGLGTELSDGSLLRVDDPRLDVVFDGAASRGLPILIHAGDPQAFFRPPTADNERHEELQAHPSWSFHGRRENGRPWPSWEQVFTQYRARVARHPEATFVGAHFGNAPEEPDRVAAMLEANPRYVVETGARIPEIGRHDPKRMRELFIEYQDRILFGTDLQMGPWGLVLGSAGREPDPPSRVPAFYRSHWKYFETRARGFPHPTPIQGDWRIDGLGLPRHVLEKIYWKNAARVFQRAPPETR